MSYENYETLVANNEESAALLERVGVGTPNSLLDFANECREMSRQERLSELDWVRKRLEIWGLCWKRPTAFALKRRREFEAMEEHLCFLLGKSPQSAKAA